jgi:hypothetical protein
MNTEHLRTLEAPAPADVPEDFVDFLRELGGPVSIRLEGIERGRTRALTTLLHGNEPSGARALHGWLRAGKRPRVSLACILGAVDAALLEPCCTHRFAPGDRDLNRCFREPFDGAEGRLAARILEALAQAEPECLVDLHNTSGASPDFAVVASESSVHEAIASRFSNRLVITDLRLGALMETSGSQFPAVTLECGAAGSAEADATARQWLDRYFLEDDVLAAPKGGRRLELYHHPVRLELAAGTQLAWGEQRRDGADLTLREDLERWNFGTADPSVRLGWLGGRGLGPLLVRNADGDDVLAAYFREHDGQLHPAQELKFFMITPSPTIALSDCLLYAAAEREHERVRVGPTG